MKFKARTGAPFSVKDAQKIGEELYRIRKKESLNPVNIVKNAKNPKSVLHQYFEWDDSKAAEEYRLSQARNIINHVVEVVVIKGKEIEERAFFNVIVNEEKTYVTLTEAVTKPSYKKQLIEEMKTTLNNLIKLLDLFSSID